MKESNPEKVIPKNQEPNYELTDSQKKEINYLIEYKSRDVKWERFNINKRRDMESFLKALKNYLFQNESIKKKIVEEGDIYIIKIISEKMYYSNEKLDPKLYFILFKAIFELYNSGLNQKYIIDYTKEIITFIQKCHNKTEIVLVNFVDLFEVLIYLNVKKMSDQSMVNLIESLDSLLKESLKPNQIIKYKLDSLFSLFDSKIKSQQYVIFELILDYIKKISSIIQDKFKPDNCLNLYIYHGILKPIFQLQMNKNISLIDEEFYKGITERICMEKYFEDYYYNNQELMNKIFQISIEESYPKNNKRNNHAWELFSLFIEKLSILINTEELKQNESKANSPKINNGKIFGNDKSFSERKIRATSVNTNIIKLAPTIIKKNKDNKDIPNKDAFICIPYKGTVIGIPYNLILEVISLIMKLYEYDNIKVDEKVSKNIIEIIKKSTNNSINIEVKNKVLDGLKNKKIKNKENLEIWLKFLLEIYLDENFVKGYIDGIPIDEINLFIKFQELLLTKKKSRFLYILGKLIDKIIDSENLVNNKQIYRSIQRSLNINSKNVLAVYKIFSRAFKLEIIDNFDEIKEKKEDNDNKKNKNEEKENKEKKYKNTLIFAEKMVCELTELLLENDNLSSFRVTFKELEQNEMLFSRLYSIWVIDPISFLILSIATEKFELAFNIIKNLKNIEFNDDIFNKLVKVVKSFEKNDYKFFCDKLLSPSKNIFFIKTLFGILMILPQGVAFDFLNEKLSNVETLLLVEDDIDNITKNINENRKEIDDKIKMCLKYQEIKKYYKIENN